ncbi:MAG: hypothetical protein KatS3mg129_2358 [Leptospiraceae bacterium]|nr:MAG: hypothetical protein KatS3mg129_2358 [Leptospiraceae bacterium]
MNFGLTWWGKKWLNALNNIDFENRLPRGKSYANSGKVISIELKNNQIFAKVKGTNIYNVELKLQPFSKKEKELLIQNLIQDSYLLSKLINRVLPEEILEIAKKHQIKIFPEKWNEIKMQCSCPDWAIPCKHIAAVMYILSKEIDQNPFAFFELRNFYIFDELKKYNIEIKSLHKETIPNIKDFILDLDNPIKKSEILYQLPDFSKLSDMKEIILSLYGKETLFFHKSFNEIIYKFYSFNNKKINNVYLLYNAKNIHLNQEDRYADFEILYDINSLNEKLILKQSDIESKKEKIASCTFEHLEKLFLTTEIKHLQNYSQSFIALYRTL